MPDTTLMAIGCYTENMAHVKGAGEGIVIAALDQATGTIEVRHVVKGPRNPSYLATSPAGDRLYAVEELGEDAGPQLHTYALDRQSGALELLSKTPCPGAAACHIKTDIAGRFLLVSNFVSGDLLCYRLDVHGIPESSPQVIGRPGDGTARVHYASEVSDGVVLVCDAGNDTIAAYGLDEDGLRPEPLYEISAASGSFPRHLAVTADGQGLLVAHEHHSTLGSVRLDDGAGVYVVVLSSLPSDWGGAKSGAAVRIHPNGQFGYMSSRAHNSIFGATISPGSLRLKPFGIWETGGVTPRDFAIDPSGRWLVAAHQDSSDLSVFPVDAETGQLGARRQRLDLGSPVSVLFL